jgi:uncharacterized membrane protein HdeD (DUF308 family)
MAQTRLGEVVQGAWWALVIRGLLALTVGFLILARPMESVAALALVIALYALMQGIVTIVNAFALRQVAGHWGVMLLSGIISAGFGVAALYYYPALSLAYAVVWTAWWLILGGVAGISIAAMERSAGLPWAWTMIWGVVGVVAAGVAFASPPATLAALLALISTFSIIAGVLLLGGAYRVRAAADTVAETVNRAHPA